MRGIIARFALVLAATALSCALAVAQVATPNPHPFTGHGPIVNAPLAAPQSPAVAQASCSPGFAASPGTLKSGHSYACFRTLSCPGAMAGLYRLSGTRSTTTPDSWSYDCSGGPGAFVCPAEMSAETLPAGTFPLNHQCGSASATCRTGMSVTSGPQGYICALPPNASVTPSSAPLCAPGFESSPMGSSGQYQCQWTSQIATIATCPGGQGTFSFGGSGAVGAPGNAEQFSCTYTPSETMACPADMAVAMGPTNNWRTSFSCVAQAWVPVCSPNMTFSKVTLQGDGALYECTPGK